ncbi:hypothetical protein J6590_068000 [Homalodisca vitripennis]|nr:hypothetical protein J6590_068000 [Homalodisca vitripennis]
MKRGILVLSLLFVTFVSVECFFRPQVRKFPIPEGDNPGKPLFLTPLIDAGKIKKAQHLSKVRPNIGNTTSYSGFLTTNKKCGNNLFFWYFPAQEDPDTAPLVLWLQGGPGASSLYGLFEENGPFNSFPDGLQTRNYSWNLKNNLLFIDQPVGTGFSFTKNGCYAKDQTDVGNDLYAALVQFMKLFPKLQKNNFFITGESFGGHYVPAIGYAIYKNNPKAKLKIKLAGMMIGDGWTDPREQIVYGDYLYQTGLVDYNELQDFYYYQEQFVQQVDHEDWSGAFDTWDTIITLYMKYAGTSVYNWLPQPADNSNWDQFVQDTSTRKAIHVGNLDFSEESDTVYQYLQNNIPQSVKPWVEELLENYPIVFYVGQVDVICGYPMVINFLRSLKWSGQQQYLNATRQQWQVDGNLAGYITGEKNLFDVLVRDAGHMVPADQPAWAFELVNSFTTGHGAFASLKKRIGL